MNITIENIELSVDSDVLFDEIRDDITSLIRRLVSDELEDAVDDLRNTVPDIVSDAVSEELRYNFDIDEHIDYDDVADEVNRRSDTSLTTAQLNDMLDSAPVRDHLMRIFAEQFALGRTFKVVRELD